MFFCLKSRMHSRCIRIECHYTFFPSIDAFLSRHRTAKQILLRQMKSHMEKLTKTTTSAHAFTKIKTKKRTTNLIECPQSMLSQFSSASIKTHVNCRTLSMGKLRKCKISRNVPSTLSTKSS